MVFTPSAAAASSSSLSARTNRPKRDRDSQVIRARHPSRRKNITKYGGILSVLLNACPKMVMPFSNKLGSSIPAWPRVIIISALIVARRISENPSVKSARYAARRRSTNKPINRPNMPPTRLPSITPSHTGIGLTSTDPFQLSIACDKQSWVSVVEVTPIGFFNTK